MNSNIMFSKIRYSLLLPIVFFLALVYLSYTSYTANQNLNIIKNDLNNTKTDLGSKLSIAQNENSLLGEALIAERARNDELGERVEKIANTVGILEKISQTDPELLQKYSKVYFLNEHYIPSDLIEIPSKYRLPEEKVMKIHTDIWKNLERLLEKADNAELDLKIISAYRSYGEQATLKTNYKVTYGYGANTFSADQGYSEHQLGTTVDFTTSSLGSNFTDFDKTKEFEWLTENAHKYGFVLSYPKNNVYYQYEPWHWRFVSLDLAGDLHRDQKYFYDLDQRKIDEYLAYFFD